VNRTLRAARMDDVPALKELIHLSVHALQVDHYSPAQREAALGTLFGVDRKLITDGTYFVVEESGRIVGCGGWSRRKAVFGGDRVRAGADPLIDPSRDPARIRAFFVHPAFARRGIGRKLLAACEAAIVAAGFSDAELVATLAGEPLYAASAYEVAERYELPMSGKLNLPVVRMKKRLLPLPSTSATPTRSDTTTS
jgi:N-acetylglutamate synthase-like GNAT family acetyltransferase